MVKPSLTGVVISQGKMAKTVKVQITKRKWNRIVSKYVTDHKNMLVHDELNKCREGDVVRIQYVRPLSARKSWAVAEIMKPMGTSWEKYQEVIPAQVQQDELRKLQQFKEILNARNATGGESAIVSDLRALEASELSHKNSLLSEERVAELREKYKITSWPADKEVFELELSRLERDIQQLTDKIDGLESFAHEARRLIEEEPAKANEILRSMGREPEHLKPSMKRNLISKHLRQNASMQASSVP